MDKMRKQFQFLALIGFSLFLFQCSSKDSLTITEIKAIDTFLQLQTEIGFSGSVLISQNNKILLSKGYGFAYLGFTFQKSAEFDELQKQAQSSGVGLWSTCTPTQSSSGKWTSNRL